MKKGGGGFEDVHIYFDINSLSEDSEAYDDCGLHDVCYLDCIIDQVALMLFLMCRHQFTIRRL